MIYLEQEIAEKWSDVEFIILNLTEKIYSSNRIKLINSGKQMGISESINKAVSSCSGEYILITNEGIIDIRCLNELLNRSSKYKLLSESFYIKKTLVNDTSVYLSKKDWLERIGGFDGQFFKDQYKDNNELDFIVNSLNYKIQLLDQAGVMFNAHLEQMRCLKKSANIVYECQINCERFVLRLIEQSPEFVHFVEGEINWIDYLADNGIKVLKAIPSLHGDYVAVIKDKSSCFLASCFIMSNGHHVHPENPHEWNDSLFEKWGQNMGKMHALSKNYIIKDLSTSRPNWNYGPIFNPDLDLGTGEDKVLKIWRNLLNELDSLPKDRDSYGLVHNDLHQNNILLDGPEIVIIDFDDSRFNWFACDIAISIYDATCTFKSEQYDFQRNFIRNFLSGYIKENDIDSFYMSLMPKFLKFREIYVYLFYLTNWNLEALDLWQIEVIKTLKSRIQNEVPCVDFDINDMLNDLSG